MFKSLVDSNFQIVDCRQLRLSGTFFALSQEQSDEIAQMIYGYINTTFDSAFVLDWTIGTRVLKDIDNSFHTRKLKNGAYTITCRGNVLCDRVYNKRSFRKYDKECYELASVLPSFGSRQSVDFSEYYETQVLPFMSDPELLKQAVQKLFDLENRVHLASCGYPDLYAFISCRPINSEKLFRGGFNLQMPFYCLCDEVDFWGEKFYEFGQKLAEEFPHTNIHIQVAPSHAESYTSYYGMYASECATVSPSLYFRSFLRHLYLTEIGWAHFISKETRTLGESGLPPADERILLTELKGGGQAVRTRNPVSTATIADLKSVKRYLYPMVLPRAQTHSFDLPLRRYWEYVPVFEDELTITEKGIQFQHHGQIDVDKARKLLGV